MSETHGAFVWHELLTTDFEAAKTFYSKVIGWDGRDPGMGMPYWMFTIPQKPVAGMMTIPPEVLQMGAPPHWEGYVGVDDVDATVAKVMALGGRVHKEPDNIPGVGRFAVVADPQGVVIALFKWEHEISGEEPPPMSPGTVGWNELYSPDAAKAFDFYSAVFGWTKRDAMDMGPMGTYQLFRHNGRDIGGMMNKPPQMPVGSWIYYFCIADIDAAVGRLNSAGGKIVMGPIQVPGGAWVVQATDPQGAFFALLGMRPTA